MKYYSIDEKGKNILIYEYKALTDRLYDYKKRKMQEEKYKLLKAYFTLKCGCDYNFKENEFNLTESNNIDNFNSNVFYEDSSLSLEEQQELLEKFYRGEVIIGSIRSFGYNSNYNIGDVDAEALFPKEINVKKDEHQFKDSEILYFTNDVIRVPGSISVLRALENGDINFIALNMDKLDDQLECFDFDTEPVDSVKIETLHVMYNGKMIQRYNYGLEFDDLVRYTIRKAKENQKILKLVKN